MKFTNKINILTAVFALTVFGATIFAIANKYQPGATLNPACSPGEENCTVEQKGKFVSGTNTNDAVYTTGNVGIGVVAPTEKLDVNGMIKGETKMIVASTDNAHYGAFEGIRLDGTAGFSLGYGDGAEVVGLNLSNATRFDITGADNVFITGDVGIGISTPEEKLHVAGNIKAGALTYESDRRLKKNITKLDNYRDILKIDAVRFNWKKNGKADVGIIAQEVQKYFPEFVHKSGGYLNVDYAKLSVPMLNMMQEQEKRLNKQEKEIQELKEVVKKLQK